MSRGLPLLFLLLLTMLLAACSPSHLSWFQQTVDESMSEAGIGEAPDVGQAPVADEGVAPIQMSAFEQCVASGEYQSVRLVGDSVTEGYGTDDYVGPEVSGSTTVIYDDGQGTVLHEGPREAKSWANEFRGWAERHGMRSFVNAGIGGWFMKQLAQNPEAWLMDGADVVVVALGTNDAGYYGPDEFRTDAEAALDAAAQRCKLLVVVAPAADLRDVSLLVEPAAELGDVLQDICEERGYVFVDPRAALTPDMFCDDGLHPNTQGSLAIWECLRQALGLSES